MSAPHDHVLLPKSCPGCLENMTKVAKAAVVWYEADPSGHAAATQALEEAVREYVDRRDSA